MCTVGIDLDLVPFAADARGAIAARVAAADLPADRPHVDAAEARLVLAMPVRDSVAVTRELAAALRSPAEIVGLAPSQTAAPDSLP